MSRRESRTSRLGTRSLNVKQQPSYRTLQTQEAFLRVHKIDRNSSGPLAGA